LQDNIKNSVPTKKDDLARAEWYKNEASRYGSQQKNVGMQISRHIGLAGGESTVSAGAGSDASLLNEFSGNTDVLARVFGVPPARGGHHTSTLF
jgi:hypothetical protein